MCAVCCTSLNDGMSRVFAWSVLTSKAVRGSLVHGVCPAHAWLCGRPDAGIMEMVDHNFRGQHGQQLICGRRIAALN